MMAKLIEGRWRQKLWSEGSPFPVPESDASPFPERSKEENELIESVTRRLTGDDHRTPIREGQEYYWRLDKQFGGGFMITNAYGKLMVYITHPCPYTEQEIKDHFKAVE